MGPDCSKRRVLDHCILWGNHCILWGNHCILWETTAYCGKPLHIVGKPLHITETCSDFGGKSLPAETVRPSTLQRRWVPRHSVCLTTTYCGVDETMYTIPRVSYPGLTLSHFENFSVFTLLRTELVLKTKDLHANHANFGGLPSRQAKLASLADGSLVQ